MNSGRWERIEQVYYSVLASPPARRTALLEELCSNDLDIRREVESLLEAREHAGTFLSSEHLQDHLSELLPERYLVGYTLDHYEVVSALGAGAMGDVYLARDTRLDRQVALKILPERFTRNSERIVRFRREARAASALNHPNIMTIYDICEVGEVWFIATEFIEGVTVRERLSRGGISLSEAVEIALQCAHALGAAHQAAIVHRDLKPENIMIRPDGLVKVVDFGLARVGESSQEAGVDATHAGALIGTPRYMSPEQARGQKLDARTDLFSLGAVLYEMATSRPAFAGSTAADVFAALLGSQPTLPSELSLGLPPHLDAIVGKALQKDRDARYQNMSELAADLERLQKELSVPSAARNTAKKPARSRWVIAVASTAALLVLFLLGWFVRSFGPGSHAAEPPTLSVVPLTSFAGFKDFGSLSPDGSRIAFSWNGGPGEGGGKLERNLYVKTIGPGDPVRITSSAEDDRLPVWSPNGRTLAFCRALAREPDASRYAIYVVPAAGGTERKIIEGGMGVSWSPDGKTLAFVDSRTESGGVFLLSVKSGARRQITYPHPYFDSLPMFSPDGRWIVFTRDFGFSAREIFVVPAGGGRVRQLTFDRQPTYGAAWTSDSREIVFASNRGVGGESLWRISLAGGTPRQLSATLEGAFYPSISRHGNRLVYTESFQDTNIYAYQGTGFGNRANPGRFSGPKSFIISSRRDDSPSISPDGERVAFISRRTGNEEVWVANRNGMSPIQLTSFRGSGTGTPRWSPDGRSIAFDSLAAGNPNIYVIAAEGGKPNRLTTGTAGNFMPAWAPDGKWIYFKSNRSGSDQIWRIPASGGPETQLTHGGASEGIPSPDGKLIYFTKAAWGAIWTVPVGGGVENPFRGLEAFNNIFRSWGVVNKGIYFISRQPTSHQVIRFFSFANSQTVPLLTLDREPIWEYPDIALSDDGRRLLIASLDQEVDDLMLVENFH